MSFTNLTVKTGPQGTVGPFFYTTNTATGDRRTYGARVLAGAIFPTNGVQAGDHLGSYMSAGGSNENNPYLSSSVRMLSTAAWNEGTSHPGQVILSPVPKGSTDGTHVLSARESGVFIGANLINDLTIDPPSSGLHVQGEIKTNSSLQVGTGTARLRACTIASNGSITSTTAGNDMMLNANANSTPVGEFVAEKVWNAVYNDFADFQELNENEKLIYGKCYYDTENGAKICTERCQQSVIGIASNTFGFAAGANNEEKQVPIAVTGWVLAYVDKEYKPGTPLTNDEFGNLTEMTQEEKINFPERLVAIYKKKEKQKKWGTENKKILVDNRHWVKIC
jgi:hypothetical protein